MYGFQSFYSLFFIFLVFYVLVLRQGVKNRSAFCFLCFVLLVILSGFRGETVGGDLKRYLPEFYGMAKVSFNELWVEGGHEPGYVLFVRLLTSVSEDSRCFLIGTTLGCLAGPYYLIKKYSKSVTTSVLLYFAFGFYTNTFNNIRQSLALSIVFFTIPFLLERKAWKYYFGVLLAITFHYSAIIMLIVYPLCAKPLNKRKLFILAASGMTLVALLSTSIFQYVAGAFLLKYDPESLMDDSAGGGYGLFVFYFTVLCLMSFYYLRSEKRLNDYNKQFLSLIVLFQLLATIIQLSSPVFHSMVRMTYYFFIPVIVIGVPFMSSTLKKKDTKLILNIVVYIIAIAYMGLMVYSQEVGENSNSQGVIPYVFFETTIF